MPHPYQPGFLSRRRRQQTDDVPSPEENIGLSLVESLSLRGVSTEKSSGLRIVNNSPGGGRQENAVAKVPGLEGTYAGVIDNHQSLLDFYKMMPKGTLSVIFAVPPNGSGASMATAEIPWSALKASEEAAAASTENNDEQAFEDTETIVADDETVVGEEECTKKGADEENNKTSPEPAAYNSPRDQPAEDTQSLYPDLAGLII